MHIEPVILEGELIRLEPLATQHAHELTDALASGELWNLTVTFVPQPAQIPAFIRNAIQALTEQRELVFAVIHKQQRRVVGTSRFRCIDIPNRNVEIGATYFGVAWQKTGVNVEAKYLMLQHAFETWHCLRVSFVTDMLNSASRQALTRIGAKQEGVLRKHLIMPDGRIRDSALYSIIRDEWSEVKTMLAARMVGKSTLEKLPGL